MIRIAATAAVLIAGTAVAISPYQTVGPWTITMPDLPEASCLASRQYPDTIFTFSLAPDLDGVWSVWLTFYSPTYTAKFGQSINAVIRFDEIETYPLTGTSDGMGLIYFWTPATEQALAALETSAWLGVTTRNTSVQYPLDGVDAAMTAVHECWDEKQRREAVES